MKRAALALILLLNGCVSAEYASKTKLGKCGAREPVHVIARSAFYWDVDFRDQRERRLFTIEGLKTNQRFTFCAEQGMGSAFILDPIGGGIGYIVQSNADPQPGGTLLVAIGSELRISFVDVLGPDAY